MQAISQSFRRGHYSSLRRSFWRASDLDIDIEVMAVCHILARFTGHAGHIVPGYRYDQALITVHTLSPGYDQDSKKRPGQTYQLWRER